MRRIGVLMGIAADDAERTARVAAFAQGLQELGWTDRPQRADRVSLERRRCRRIRRYAAELVALAPDVIVASGSVRSGRRATGGPHRSDRVPQRASTRSAAGFVASLARPGGNATGFHRIRIRHQRQMAGAAQADRARHYARGGPSDPAISGGIGQLGAIQAAAPSLGVEVSPVDVRDAAEIERAITAFARGPNGGLIVTGERIGDSFIAS